MGFFASSRGLTNETYYVAQKVARFFGTNNIDNAARLCHSPSTGAMKRALGIAATTCSYADWWGSDLIVFFGSNPAEVRIGPRKGLRVLALEDDYGYDMIE